MQNSRIRQITTALINDKKVNAKALAAQFGVSIETIRRDLTELEDEGIARKVYGGAVLAEDHQPSGEAELWKVRLTENLRAKQAIAKATLGLIEDGATIFLDSGTTLLELVLLLKERKNLTVITRSLRNAAELGMCEALTVYCIGGTVKVDTLINTGFMAQECLNYFSHIDLTILSGDGIIPHEGVVDYGMENFGFKRSLLDRSDRVVVAIDHSKFGQTAHCITCPTERITTLVTDEAAPVQSLQVLQNLGVNVLIAKEN